MKRMAKYIRLKWSGNVSIQSDIPVAAFMTEEQIEHCRNGLLNGLLEKELKEMLEEELGTGLVDVKRESIHVSKVREHA